MILVIRARSGLVWILYSDKGETDRYPEDRLLVHQLIKKYLSTYYVKGNVGGERGSDIISDITESIIDKEDTGCIHLPSSVC